MPGYITREEIAESLIQYIDSKKITSVGTSLIADGAVTEIKLETAVKNKLNKDTYTKQETNSQIDTRVQALIGAAPEALDTLVELSNALGNDPNFAATITQQLGTKIGKSGAIVANKVAIFSDTAGNVKDSGLTLGTSVPANAVFTDTVYTHPGSHPASIIAQDANNRFVTDAQKSTWDAKASTAVASTTTNGLMSAADKVKVDGIANTYQPKVGFSKNTVNLSVASKTVTIGVSGFDKSRHMLMVFKNSVYLEETVDYIVSADNLTITCADSSYTFAKDTVFNFIVLKI